MGDAAPVFPRRRAAMEARRGQCAAAFVLAAAVLLATVEGYSPEDHAGSWSQEEHQGPQAICYDYRSRNHMGQPLSVCCEGWEEVSARSRRPGDDPECKPICSPACKWSVCTKPGHCECMDGYIRTSQHECQPLCQPPCVNGDCHLPNRCKCWPGYTGSARSNVCREGSQRTSNISLSPRAPSCSPACAHASCVTGNKCECHAGFRQHPKRPWACVPHCRTPCGANEICSAPDHCACAQGYARARDGRCTPQCTVLCINGRCVAPDVCECLEGYEEMTEDGESWCVAACHPPCGPNGDCQGVNNCMCYDGFIRSSAGDCIGNCSSSQQWDPNIVGCVELPTTLDAPSSTDPPYPPPFPSSTPHPPRSPPPPPPPTLPPPPPSPRCVTPCVRGVCVGARRGRGRCACENGWAGTACSRPCRAVKDSVMVDTDDCPTMEGCVCGAVNRTQHGVFCARGAEYLCGAAAAAAVAAASTGAAHDAPAAAAALLAGWGLWTAAAAAALALVLLVAAPSAVALHRRHRRQRREREDDDRQRVLQTKGAGGGRLHEVDLGNDWRFTSY